MRACVRACVCVLGRECVCVKAEKLHSPCLNDCFKCVVCIVCTVFISFVNNNGGCELMHVSVYPCMHVCVYACMRAHLHV